MQPDILLYHAPAELYSKSRSGRDWFNLLSRRHALGRWLLLADIDELIAWPDYERENPEQLVCRAERMGLNRVFTPMVDVYPNGPCSELPKYEPGRPFEDWACWIDAVTYVKAFWGEGQRRLILYSGPRNRLYAGDARPPLMTKQSLYFVENDGYQHIGPHFCTYVRPSPLVAILLHYKFLPDFEARAKQAVLEGQRWNDASEYRNYLSTDLYTRSLTFEGSVNVHKNNEIRNYINALANTIRGAGLCGSNHWEKPRTIASTEAS